MAGHISIVKVVAVPKDSEDVLNCSHHFEGDLDPDNLSVDDEGDALYASSTETEEDPVNEEFDWGLTLGFEPVALGYQSREREGFDPHVHFAPPCRKSKAAILEIEATKLLATSSPPPPAHP